MGKNTINNRKKKLAKLRKKNASKLNLESLTIKELLIRAQEQIDSFQYDCAQIYCQEALKRDPDNVLALETSSSLCIEVGNLDGAKHCLGRAITLKPDDGYAKYMSMAQLLEGKESLQCYQKGIELLKAVIEGFQQSVKENEAKCTENNISRNSVGEVEMVTEHNGCNVDASKETSLDEAAGVKDEPLPSSSSAEPEDNIAVIIRQTSSAYCSVAELFMTDLCDEEDAENQCHANITNAIDADPSSPEAYQLMASFLLVKQDIEEARKYITKSLQIWLPKYKEVEEDKAETGTFDPVEVCPLSYTARLSTARILIEVEDHKHAVEVLEGLTEENDEVVDTWYLLGWSYYLQGEEYRDRAKYYLHRAMQIHSTAPSDDVQLIEHLKELQQELGPYVEEEVLDEADIEDELERGSEDEQLQNEEMDIS
ncbi:uncharacterized protein [Panulirus ornatus]|uniref:uncharacterized protein n=1 Tax=Panulirus ornatus TaxID=150431 RepID=UPI003A849E1D